MATFDFQITRISDAAFIDRISAAVGVLGRSLVDTKLCFQGAELSPDKRPECLAHNSAICNAILLQLNTNETVQLSRPNEPNKFLDSVKLSPSPQADPVQFIGLIAQVRKTLPDAANLSPVEVLSEEERNLLFNRHAEIHRIEQIQLTFFEKFQDFVLKQEQRYNDLKAGLEADVNSQKKRIDEEQAASQATIDEQKAELDKQRKKFDGREATHVRRELREKLHDEIKNRQTKSELTAGTHDRRKQVGYAWTAFLVSVGVLVVISLVHNVHLAGGMPDDFATPPNPKAPAQEYNWFTPIYVTSTEYFMQWVRQSVLIATFVVSFLFFIRWLNQWFTRHADEEFKTKRLQLDVDRASWVYETTLSWKEEKDGPLPEFLIERLSRNLFVDEEATDHNVSAADSLASALFGQSGRIKLLMSGNEVEIVKGRRKLRKPSPK